MKATTNFEARQHGAMEFSVAPVDLNNVRKYRLQRLRKKIAKNKKNQLPTEGTTVRVV